MHPTWGGGRHAPDHLLCTTLPRHTSPALVPQPPLLPCTTTCCTSLMPAPAPPRHPAGPILTHTATLLDPTLTLPSPPTPPHPLPGSAEREHRQRRLRELESEYQDLKAQRRENKAQEKATEAVEALKKVFAGEAG